ncbi:uncharacterized protein Dana_GF26401 [Drosophila ananassae]|uniref:Uncharacterized protein n=1 Tax=Drosophila ananassae TaxID=7217 RepID=A0A0P8YLD5_DROAN|nr:uncharacterized protein Dana_GF26401 [Drosophila ananassae]
MEPAAVKAKHAPAQLPVLAKMQFVGEIKLNGISPSRQLDMLESGKLKKDSVHQMPSRRKAFGQVQMFSAKVWGLLVPLLSFRAGGD